jgi:2-hydroxychromene-2-carboxylate isomerase
LLGNRLSVWGRNSYRLPRTIAARHRRIRADYLERDVIRYAADRGLPMERLHRRQDSTAAALGLIWLRQEDPSLAQAYVERVFRDYWGGNLNIEGPGSIRSLLAELKAPVAGFEGFLAGEGRVELSRIQTELRQRGVFDVPTYLLGHEIFFGRQHLPLLRARMSRLSEGT